MLTSNPLIPLDRNTRLVLVLACVVHFVLGGSVGLSVDEAHYALYATHLALSYFDHPPLVGWVQWPLVAMDAPTAVLRLIPEALWLGTVLMVHGIAVRLQLQRQDAAAGARAGFWAVLVLALSPLLHVLGIGLLPDTLLMFFTAALVWWTLDLIQPDALRRPALWGVLGLLLGLAISMVLVFVVNPQSFHWTMHIVLPAGRLAALCAAVMLAGTATAALSARSAAGRSAVMSVKEDW